MIRLHELPGDWDESYFRDYLIAHTEIAAEYAELKAKLHKGFEHDRNAMPRQKLHSSIWRKRGSRKAMVKVILETPRLTLREMTQSDMPNLSAILQDEQTMYPYEGAFSDAETQEWLNRNLKRYQEDGVGLWAVILKDTGTMIGQAGITMQDVEGERVPEIGYLFNRSYWRNGYAIEAAVACKEYGFAMLGYSEIFTIVRDTNIPSLNVAIRNGMLIRKRFVKHYRGVDMPHFVFSARADDKHYKA